MKNKYVVEIMNQVAEVFICYEKVCSCNLRRDKAHILNNGSFVIIPMF